MVSVVMHRSVRDGDDQPAAVTVGPVRLALAGVIAAGWAVLPPYSGPALATSTRVEVADHVVPGLVLLVVALAVLVTAGSRSLSPVVLLGAGLLVSLAGLWMTFTHLPLVAQAVDAQAPWAATLYHTVPGLAVLALGFIWARSYWSAAG